MISRLIIGTEIEGSWKDSIWEDYIPGVYEVKSDGSLTCSYPAEVTTYPVIELGVYELILESLKPYYLGCNSSCGFHIHVSVASFTKNIYLEKRKEYLIEPSLYLDRKKTWDLKQKLFARLDKFASEVVRVFPEVENRLGNSYCLKPKTQEIARSRYQMINFLSPHGDIEIRVFPASNNLEKYLEYLQFVIEFLASLKEKGKYYFVF